MMVMSPLNSYETSMVAGFGIATNGHQHELAIHFSVINPARAVFVYNWVCKMRRISICSSPGEIKSRTISLAAVVEMLSGPGCGGVNPSYPLPEKRAWRMTSMASSVG
jgi:hypothetical protein